MRLRPHGRVLVVPALVLVAAMGLAGFAAAAIPESQYQGLLRAVVAVVLVLVVVRASVVPFLRWLTTTLTITDARVRTRQGVLRSRTRDVALSRIADVVVERTVLQRMVGAGTLLLDTTGERGGILVRDVPGVVAVAAELNDLLDEADQRDDEGVLEAD